MIMSLLSVTGILLVSVQFGTLRVIRDVYEKEMYPLQIRSNDGSKEWSILVPKYISRFIKNKLDCYEVQRLEDLELKQATRLIWRFVMDEVDRVTKKRSWYLQRRWNIRPLVEIAPGAFKHDIVNFPPDTLAKEMKKLFALQKRQEDQTKDLNEGNE